MRRTQDLDLRQNLRWEGTKSDDLFFEPLEEKNTVMGVETGHKTIFRLKDGKPRVISTVSNDYSLVTNERLNRIIENFDEMELKLNTELSGIRDNKRSNLVYNIESENNFGSDSSDGSGGGLLPQLIVKNSYDRSQSIELLFGFFRTICSNGLIVPLRNQVFRFRKKHQGINGDLQMMIHEFLRKVLNEKVFERVRQKIIKAKQKRETIIPYTFFKQLPYYQLFPFIYGIYKHSQHKVTVVDTEQEYSLNSEADVNKLLYRIVKERSGEERAEKVLTRRWDTASSLKYAEDVTNHWQLINLLIKIAQYKVAQNRRWQIASQISKLM